MFMNTAIFYFFYHFSHKSHIFDQVIIFVTDKADKLVLLAAVLYLIYFFLSNKDWKGRRWTAWLKESIVIGISVVGAYALSYGLKILAHAPRPFVTHLDVQPLVSETPFSSFPSGHATLFFALATSIYLYDKRVGGIFFVCASIIALSRVVAGVHYPIDIIAGAVIGVGAAYLFHRIVNTIFSRKNL